MKLHSDDVVSFQVTLTKTHVLLLTHGVALAFGALLYAAFRVG